MKRVIRAWDDSRPVDLYAKSIDGQWFKIFEGITEAQAMEIWRAGFETGQNIFSIENDEGRRVQELNRKALSSDSITTSTDAQHSMKLLRKDDLNVSLPDRIILTDNGVYDLEKQGMSGYYTWIGYVHKGSRSDPKMAHEVKNVAYNIVVPALVDFCQEQGLEIYEDDVEVEDYIGPLDMFRVWVDTRE